MSTHRMHTVYDLYLAVTLIWRFGSVALQPPIIVSANRRLHCRSNDDSEEVTPPPNRLGQATAKLNSRQI